MCFLCGPTTGRHFPAEFSERTTHEIGATGIPFTAEKNEAQGREMTCSKAMRPLINEARTGTLAL